MKASIIFVDPSVANYQTLLQGSNPDAEVVVLDAQRSGIAQITETLANRQDIAQLHLLTHGSAGNLHLGSDFFNTENLEKFSSQIKQWGKSLTKNADILLYGCQVAATTTGKIFVEHLHQLTKANIAASKHPVGNPKKGGTWNLEYTVGNITSPIAFSPEVCAAYPGIFGASFGTASNFGVGSRARFIAVKDFNGDGQLDMVVVNENSDDVSVLLGNGAGSFGAATNLAVGDLPLSVAAGDFNGDGNQDMAVANYNSSNVSVLLGNGAGGFGSPSNFTGGASPRSVAVGDFNSDGKLDMVTANRNSGNVTVFLGNGAGSFGAASGFAVGSTPLGAVVGDFNGDSKQDLAVVKYGSNQISVLLGDGSGSFGAATNFTVGTDPRFVAVGDFNSDGKQDMAVANLTSSNVSVLLGNGAGSFGAATNFAAGTGPFSVAVVDSNLDGKQDLAVANITSNNVSVLLGDGSGGFAAATNFGVADSPNFVTVGDFNHDGKQDIVTTNGGASNNVSVLLNTFPTVTLAAGTTPSETGPTNGTFTITLDEPAPTGGLTVNYNTTGSTAANPAHYSFDQPTSTNITAVTASTFTIAAGATTATLAVKPVDDSILNPGETVTVNLTTSPDYILGPTSGATVEFTAATHSTGTNPMGIAVGDFNSDGKQDMVTANRSSNDVSVFLGNGAGSFGAATNFATGNVPSQVQLGDFNGDGQQDMAVTNYVSGTVSVLLGNGAGSFNPATNFSVPSAFGLAVGDFNGDGKLDLTTANYGSNNVSLLLGNGSGGFGAATNFSAGTSPTAIAVGDFNGDGKQDMAVANKNSNNVSVLLGNGSGSFGSASSLAVGINPVGLTAGDVNGDGKLDLTTANYGSNNVSLLLGNGSGGFGAATNLPAGTQTHGVIIADVNGDGKQDLTATNLGSNNVSMLLGNGSGGFAAATNFAAGTRPHYLAAGDFNSDGKLDIAAANMNSNNVSVLLNNNQPTATLTITDNDNVEIDLQGNTTSIADGDTTPSLTDHTDFGGATTTSGSVTRTFTIANTGPDPLTLTGSPLVSISGANAADFSVTATPAATVGSSSQTTFEVTFTPSALGVRTADIAIASNDNDENPYNFTIQGTGTSIPTVSNITKTGNEDSNITFAAIDFTSAFTDADGDPLNKIKITSLPANGTLQLSGSGNVSLNQEILLADIPNLIFTPTTNFNSNNGSSSFTWNGSDGSNYAPTDATANLTVAAVNDPPSFTNAGNQTLTNWTNTAQTVSNWANTFVFGPTADENSQVVADFLVSVTSGNSLFTIVPDIANNGTLTYTPTGEPGTANISVQLQDNGGTANGGVDTSTAANFTIIIPPPTVNLTVDTTTGTEAGTTAITLTATAAGPVVGNQTLNLALTGTADNSDFSSTIPAQITIPNGSNSAQVTLTVANDLIDEDSETATFTISNPSVGIALGTTTSQTITITDDDTAGYDITGISGDTSELGGQATFDIKLTSQPTSTVTLNFTSSDTSEGTVIPTVTFDATNWNQYQTITVTGVDDFGDDDNIAYNIITSAATSTDTKYNGINPVDVAVINTDNDTAGVALSSTNVAAYEGGAGGSYTAVLTSKPTATVTLNFNGGRQINPLAALTFNSNNWNVPQPVIITAIDDTVAEGLQTEIISHTVTSADANYNGVNVGTVTATITDNDTAAAPVVQPLGRMDVRESGGEDVYKLFLTTQPTANVNVAIVTDGQTTANVPYLTFTTDDWNVPQLVRVSAVDDAVVEGPHTSNITFVASSLDGAYNNLVIAGITVNIADNDNVGLVRSLPTPATVMGTVVDDKIVGSSGDDVINARSGNNYIDGGDGNDVLLGGSGADYITGGAGLDQILSGPGEDYVDGGDDDDVMLAGTGSDRLYGGTGNDKLFGEQGDDYLFGGAGVDTLTGGPGRDGFAIGNGSGGMTGEMADVITDFVIGEDVIDLIPALVFGDLSMVQNGADAVIQNAVTSEFLARLQGVDAVSLSQVDFV
ncbi:FG-GAP-like repeat-containing protein [[Phormidium] sp. ETS-05]|uniref:FG-GAP-like repeat-containing protein n=1 Tax=[Phormidium] sp. ETS-05 TaxID=222819 RepID=UPI0018EEE401|nr:FG-GAP-like repeat-containing protein [[Phormidium] sp. ETS-05]